MCNLKPTELQELASTIACAIGLPVRSPLLSAAEAAAYLRTSEYRVRRLAQRGEISKVKDGRSVWFTISDLDQYIEKQRVKAMNPFQTSRPKKRR